MSTIIGDLDFDEIDLTFREADVVPSDDIHDVNGEDSSGEEGDDPGHISDWEDDVGDDVEHSFSENPEKIPLVMPSSLDRDTISQYNMGKLAQQELKLREGQANDCLQCLCLALGHKSLLFRTQVR